VLEAERGFGVQIYQTYIGEGRSSFSAISFAEMLPRHENHLMINQRKVDRWGIPTLHIDCRHGPHEIKLFIDQRKALATLADAVGVSVNYLDEAPLPPGCSIHECGTARMGVEPTQSVLDPNNQCWDAAGLYVTDSASFPSQGSKSPTLTVLALTARACEHAMLKG
jgi:choline dehydrogenase-like flavoprotein